MIDVLIKMCFPMALVIASCAQNMAKAEPSLPKPEYSLIYMTSNGRQIESHDAILAAVKGETVYKCQTVEAKISKSGTSIGVRNVKKPKSQ